MLHNQNSFLLNRLNQRKDAGNFRTLKPDASHLVDFSSNDYLGFSRSLQLKQMIEEELLNYSHLNGSTGSRLLSGNLAYTEELEQTLAEYHSHNSGLLFNSGYDANIGLFSSLGQRGDTVITDELIHASIIDGIKLSNANRYTFKHNNLNSLEEKLRNAKGNVYIAIESVYSMDGDIAPIKEIIALANQYTAAVIVDEAHAIGVFGKGLIDKLQLQPQIFARVITFGKALGVHGAIVLGSALLRDYLINYARSFIYTTAASFHQIASIKMAYQLLEQSKQEIDKLHSNLGLFKKLSQQYGLNVIGESAINCIIAGSTAKAIAIATKLKEAKINVLPVLSPTVAEGTERLRICMHSYNTPSEITVLADTLNDALNA